MEIRKLTQADVPIYWDLRLLALKTNPESFGSSYEESVRRPLEVVRERFQETSEHFMIGAFDEAEQLIGMAGFLRKQGLKLMHRGEIWSVFTHPDHRGKGVAKQILNEIIARAKQLPGLVQIHLAVVKTNEPAVKLYQSLGFEIYGTEARALRVGERFLDEEMMVLFLQ